MRIIFGALAVMFIASIVELIKWAWSKTETMITNNKEIFG